MRNALLEVVATYRGTVLDVQHLRPASRYTVGEGEAASFSAPPVDLLTPEGFELARVSEAGAAWIRFAPGMRGEIAAGDRRYTLQQWNQRGWTIAEDGALGTTLPPGGRARIQHGEVTFHLAQVESAELRVGRANVDAPFWAITAGTFVVLVTLLVLANLAMPGAARLDLDQHARANRFVAYVHRPDRPDRARAPRRSSRAVPTSSAETAPDSPSVEPAREPRRAHALRPQASDAPEVARARRSGSGGARSVRSAGSEPTVLGMRSVQKAGDLMARGGGPIATARSAGVLAMVDVSEVVDNPYANAFSPDTDDREMWEAMNGQDFMAHSAAGRLLVGKGRGGGAEALEELVTTEDEPEAAVEDEIRSLRVRAGSATVRGPRAADAVRSVVVRHVRELRACYDQGVDRDPRLAGELTLKLEIDAAGEVVRASASRFSDPGVGDCMASAAKRWRFSEVERSRRSHVSVPLTLRRR